MTYRLNELIEDEAYDVFDMLGGLDKKLVRLHALRKEDALANILKTLEAFQSQTELDDIPECNSAHERGKVNARNYLDFIANARLYLILNELNNDGKEAPESAYRSVNKMVDREETEDQAEFFVFEYFVKRRADEVAKKLPDYQKTLAEINADKNLNGFGKAFREAYKRLEFELRDTHPKALAALPAKAGPVDTASYVELVMSLEEGSLERYAAKAREIRTQELVLDSLTRIYEKYKKGFE